MVGLSSGVFRCVLMTPEGKVFDDRPGQIILPAHDGLIGILRNHAPMLCELGSGIMEVRDIAGAGDAFYLIEGGFARISENFVTVLAYDVTTFEGMDPHDAEKLVSRASSVVVGGSYISQTEEMDPARAALLVKMGKLASVLPAEEN